MSEPVIRTEHLGKLFADPSGFLSRKPAGGVRAVSDVSLDVEPGETLAVVGESGCGKSTLGRLLLRLITPTEGKVFLEGEEITGLSVTRMRQLRRKAQIIFQDPFGSLSPRRTISQIISEPLDAFGLVKSNAQRRDRVAELLTKVGLPTSMMDRHPRQFSGGQRQRICVARAISVNPSFIVADEPVSALDVSVQAQVINLLQDLQKENGFSCMFIAHDLAVVRHIASRVAVMYLGRIIELGTRKQVYETPHHPYTQALLSAAPEPTLVKKRARIVLQGDVPSPRKIPAGCSFHTRCPIAQDICRRELPVLHSVDGAQATACHFAAPHPIAIEAAGLAPRRREPLVSTSDGAH